MIAQRLIDVYGMAGAIQVALGLTLSEARWLCWCVRLPLVKRSDLRRIDVRASRIAPDRVKRKLRAHGIEIHTRRGVGYELAAESRLKLLKIVEREIETLDAESAPEYVSEHAR